MKTKDIILSAILFGVTVFFIVWVCAPNPRVKCCKEAYRVIETGRPNAQFKTVGYAEAVFRTMYYSMDAKKQENIRRFVAARKRAAERRAVRRAQATAELNEMLSKK